MKGTHLLSVFSIMLALLLSSKLHLLSRHTLLQSFDTSLLRRQWLDGIHYFNYSHTTI